MKNETPECLAIFNVTLALSQGAIVWNDDGIPIVLMIILMMINRRWKEKSTIAPPRALRKDKFGRVLQICLTKLG